jgi:hypothetical protein
MVEHGRAEKRFMVPTHDGRPTQRVSDIATRRGEPHHRLPEHRAILHRRNAVGSSFVRNFFYVLRRCA